MQLPAPTQQQLVQAFEALAIRDRHLARMSFAAAMQDPIWQRVIRLRACLDRKKAYQASTTRKVQLVRRCNPATGEWRTQRVLGAYDDSQPTLN
jgi:hypothetical protein